MKVYFLAKKLQTCIWFNRFRYELEEDEEARAFCRRLTRLLGDLIYVGSKELHFKANAVVEVFQLPGYRLNVPRAKGIWFPNCPVDAQIVSVA